MGFGVLAGLSVLAWLLIFWKVHEPAQPAHSTHPRESVGAAIRGFGALFLLPHTAGIMLLALTTYASFLTLRGLWLGPLLIERHGYSLIASGNVAMLYAGVRPERVRRLVNLEGYGLPDSPPTATRAPTSRSVWR